MGCVGLGDADPASPHEYLGCVSRSEPGSASFQGRPVEDATIAGDLIHGGTSISLVSDINTGGAGTIIKKSRLTSRQDVKWKLKRSLIPAGKNRLKLAVRKDTPVIRPAGRGSLAKALAAGAPDKRLETLEKLRLDEVAPSGRGPKESRWRTWCRLHRNWLDTPVLPLTMESIAAVTAQLKEGSYHATPDYVSTAKSRHLRRYEWTSMLAR